uniref:RING-type domain-containing protein n=1 Tax=Geospiza parvula TaxID=87175 RepID=A0A8C3Q7X6_GEOPR
CDVSRVRLTDKAMGTEWSCPICHDEQEGVAYVIPCGHEFCMGCILRWAEKKPECPLCRRLIESVRFSLQEQEINCYFPDTITGCCFVSPHLGPVPHP